MIIEVIPNEQTPIIPIQENFQGYVSNLEKSQAFLEYAKTRYDAVGLAANQVSIDGERFMVRMFALKDISTKEWRLIINPTITEYYGIKDIKHEGCLTWRSATVVAERSRFIKVTYYDITGRKIVDEIHKGFEGQIWQHEINHLNGVTEEINYLQDLEPRPIDVGRNEQCPCGKLDVTIDVFKLHEIYDNGMTMQELEDTFGISRKVIGRLFKKHGLHIRTKSENKIGELNGSFDGNPRYTKDGYIEIWNGSKRILEHRYIMEQYLNRKLNSDEVIHHINGIKDDNDINNLELTNQSEHMKKHKLPIGQWSHHYDCCIKCGTTERNHAGNGYCTKCNMLIRTDKKRGFETEYDENGKRIFTESHREKLKESAILREVKKKYKDCCLI